LNCWPRTGEEDGFETDGEWIIMDPKALWKLSYGLYVVSSGTDGRFNGQIANTVFQITAEPPTIGISINKGNLTHEYIEKSKAFSISVLSTDTPMQFIGLCGFRCGRDIDKFDTLTYTVGKTGVPIVTDHTVAFLECRVTRSFDLGSHTLFIGEPADAGIIDETKDLLTYEFYHRTMKGKAPKAATTYIPDTVQPASVKGEKDG
jgi:ferric-chelate reductase [NAD(P)H]